MSLLVPRAQKELRKLRADLLDRAVPHQLSSGKAINKMASGPGDKERFKTAPVSLRACSCNSLPRDLPGRSVLCYSIPCSRVEGCGWEGLGACQGRSLVSQQDVQAPDF